MARGKARLNRGDCAALWVVIVVACACGVIAAVQSNAVALTIALAFALACVAALVSKTPPQNPVHELLRSGLAKLARRDEPKAK